MTETGPSSSGPDPAETPRTISDLFRSMATHIEEILRSELRLARAEIREGIRQAAGTGKYMAAAGLTGVFAIGFVLLAAVYGLSVFIPAWAAALAVGLGLGLISAVSFGVGRSRMKQFRTRPNETIDSVKENVAWIRKRAG